MDVPNSQMLLPFKRKRKNKKKLIDPLLIIRKSSLVNKYADAIRLYDRTTLYCCSWPKNAQGEYAKNYLAPLMMQGVNSYIKNVQTNLYLLVWDQIILPITVNDTEYENAYVCSPYSYYISYASHSLDFIEQKWMQASIKFVLAGLGKVLKTFQINKVVSINNWFCSTNLYPHLSEAQLKKITSFLQERFPHHALVFRSIAQEITPSYYQTLPRLNYTLIASRQIFFIDSIKQQELTQARLFKSDIKLLQKSGYEILTNDDLTEEDAPRLIQLYKDLYIDKYSQLNPDFTEDFVKLALKNHLLHFRVLKKNQKIDGVVAFTVQNNQLFCPYFGYDQYLPTETALYRLLSTILMLEAQKREVLFHQSSGASTYKKIRKGQNAIEYLAINCSHLSYLRRLPWYLLKGLYNTIGRYCMKFY